VIWACRHKSPGSGRAPLTYQLAADLDPRAGDHAIAQIRVADDRAGVSATVAGKSAESANFVAALFFPRPQNPAVSAGFMAPLFFPRATVWRSPFTA
jgi:hypothetical protein